MSAPYHTYTYNDPFFIKRWLHRRRFDDAIDLLDLKKDDQLLDYGCGDGYFLKVLADGKIIGSLYGFEPAGNMFEQAKKNLTGTNVELFREYQEFQNKRFDKISCLETGEHLSDQDLGILFGQIKNILAESGQVVFSVPLEIGLPALVKNIYRLPKKQHHDNLTAGNFFRSVFGLRINRRISQIDNNIDYIFSHMGFDFRDFEKILYQNFKIEKRVFKPLPFLGWVFNNTIYYSCIKR